jgi:hypothetical protein
MAVSANETPTGEDMRKTLVSSSLLTFAILLTLALPATGQTVPPEFFGMHVHGNSDFNQINWPLVPFGTLRLWDTQTSWWDINTSSGVYNWSLLDQFVSYANSHNLTVLYEVSQTPTWASTFKTDPCTKDNPPKYGSCDRPTNWSDLDNFISALATRYNGANGHGRIQYYETWNEPHNCTYWNSPPCSTNNTDAQFVTLIQHIYNDIRAADSSAKIISPSGTPSWMDVHYYGKITGTIPAFDVISQHIYPGQGGTAQVVTADTTGMRRIMSKYGLSQPLWTTEGSWGNANNGMADQLKTAFVSQWAILHWSNGVGRFIWYAWDNQGWGTLFDTTNNMELPGGFAYNQTYTWMVGSTVNPCSNQANVWTCGVVTSSSGGEFVWYNVQDGSTTNYTVPPGISWEQDINGNRTPVHPGEIISVGDNPVLLTSLSQ